MQRFEGRQTCIDGRDLGISGSYVYCAKTETLIPYKPTPQQLRAALLVSGNCSQTDRKSTRLNSSHTVISYAVFCLKKKKQKKNNKKQKKKKQKNKHKNEQIEK